MVNDLQVAEADITGELATGKLISPMITSTVAEGTPLVQLVAVACVHQENLADLKAVGLFEKNVLIGAAGE